MIESFIALLIKLQENIEIQSLYMRFCRPIAKAQGSCTALWIKYTANNVSAKTKPSNFLDPSTTSHARRHESYDRGTVLDWKNNYDSAENTDPHVADSFHNHQDKKGKALEKTFLIYDEKSNGKGGVLHGVGAFSWNMMNEHRLSNKKEKSDILYFYFLFYSFFISLPALSNSPLIRTKEIWMLFDLRL